MIDLSIGGVDPRQPFMRALLALTGMPAGQGTGADAFFVGIVDHPSEQALTQAARAVVDQRQDAVFALFADQDAAECGGLALMWRALEGVHVVHVEPFQADQNAPVTFISHDRSRAFALDQRCVLNEVEMPTRNIDQGVARAWTTIRTTMAKVIANPADWSVGEFTTLPTPLSRSNKRR